MEFVNNYFQRICAEDLDLKEKLTIRNAVIDELELGFEEFQAEVVIENCKIRRLGLHTSWFQQGLVLRNCYVDEQVQFEMGGHNLQPIVITHNVFRSIFVFFDCYFMSELVVQNNVFIEGCTLWNNYNMFDSPVKQGDNMGSMDVLRMD